MSIIPAISRDEMIEVDRIMVDDLSVPVELMMEHAGLNLARIAVNLINESRQFQIICGSGNNAGGGLVAARHLFSWGFAVEVSLLKPEEFLSRTPKEQLERARKLGIPVNTSLPSNANKDITILDCYIGYNYRQREDRVTKSVFNFFRENEKQVIALDVPSGLDVNTGISDGHFSPLATLTLAFVKNGFLQANLSSIGELYICDIGIPKNIFQYNLGLNWNFPYSISALDDLYSSFSRNSIQQVIIQPNGWKVESKKQFHR